MQILENIHRHSNYPVQILCLALHSPKGHWKVVTLLNAAGGLCWWGSTIPAAHRDTRRAARLQINKCALFYPHYEGYVLSVSGYVLSVSYYLLSVSGGLCWFDILSYVFLCKVFLFRQVFLKRIVANSEVGLRQLCLKLAIGFIFVFSG